MTADMPDDGIRTSGQVSRHAMHASITADQIADLVDRFYARARRDERLGPLFEAHVVGDWGPHLEKMKAFWRSVLLRTAEYHGRPVPAHAKIAGIEEADFRIWLGHFRETVEDVFAPEARAIVIESAERIATSLWIATNGDLLARPPDWTTPAAPV